ncbi:CHAP domain-containing protein [Inquilinus limosus]|uniref:CHAP domain-containing protein n=1 Tax=Inquilinus limosus TaxID=171674 RepID=UPI003F14C272
MTRDTDYDLRIHHRARRPLSTLTASLLTLVCSVALLSETAHAASRTTRELNAAAAAAAGQPSDQVEGAVRNAVANNQAAASPASTAEQPARERKTATAPAPRRARTPAPAAVDAPIPRSQLTARNFTEQRQIQRVATLKAQNRRWSCVPFARELTGFQITGDAWRWWDAAAGRYNRGRMPVAGSVIVLKRSGAMRRGHVAVVRRVVSSREIIVDQANWAPRGRVNEPARVIDVSPKNDWSQTRFWHQPTGQMGTKVYPAYGFIYAPSTQVAERAD